ncbi:MAG: PTS sugar transporter subunit IIA [Kiritimatiellaeota bacterium]|nr:PTS sugar transporter subunit IIA [Kiritimatiellota bacterium]
MHKIINDLVQLQELMVARSQQVASMPDARLTQLEEAIRTLFQSLPPEVALRFKRIEERNPLAIVPVANGICSACGMALPVSLVHDIHAADRLHQCPNCARLLYYRATYARRILKPAARRGTAPKVSIERFSSEELMIPQLASAGRDDVIRELCMKMEVEGFVDNGSRLFEEALKREAIVSTAVDYSLAFPHVRGVEGGGLTLALGLHSKGLKFGGPSRLLTKIIFFMVIPTAASAFYLKLLAGLTRTFEKEENRKKLIEADTPEKLWKTLVKLTKNTIL